MYKKSNLFSAFFIFSSFSLFISCSNLINQSIYTVTYDGNSIVSGNLPIDSKTYSLGETVIVKLHDDNLSRSGYIFMGWNTKSDGSGPTYLQNQSFSMGSSNVILYAIWYQSLSIKYNGNGNSTGIVPVDSKLYLAGESITVLGNSGNLSKGGYIYNGWNTKTDGSGVTYKQDQSFTIGESAVTLYALWLPTYSITYNGNANNGGTAPQDLSRYVNGQSVTVLDNVGLLTKTGYTFGGWSTENDGGGIRYFPGIVIAMGNANVILYANWISSSGSIIKSDNFDRSTLGSLWYTNTYGTYSIVDNKYQITDLVDSYVASSVFADFDNESSFQVSVDTEWISGVEDYVINHSYGLMFRNTGGNNQYRFEIASENAGSLGYYRFSAGTHTLVDWEHSTVINAYGWNRLSVQCNGTKYTLLINGTIIQTIEDTSFQEGKIALFVGGGCSVSFDNYKITVYP